MMAPKRSPRCEEDQAGCMWGLVCLFHFRNGRFTRRLISDRRRGSSRHSAGNHPGRDHVQISKSCKVAARPNPQGSFKYGQINVTDVYVLKNKPPVTIDGKHRTTLNGISYSAPSTPLRLADQFHVKGVYKLDFPTRPLVGAPQIGTSVINGTYRGFMEVIFQNNDTSVQSYHMDGYAFFVVGMDFGDWTENSRGTYNKWDGVARCTTQVFPGAWTAVLVSLDNVGVWNVRAQNLDTWYLGQEVYVRVVNPEITNKTELPIPDNALYCGALSHLQKPQKLHSKSSASSIMAQRVKQLILMLLFAAIAIFH